MTCDRRVLEVSCVTWGSLGVAALFALSLCGHRTLTDVYVVINLETKMPRRGVNTVVEYSRAGETGRPAVARAHVQSAPRQFPQEILGLPEEHAGQTQ